jgi:hypothetical protein
MRRRGRVSSSETYGRAVTAFRFSLGRVLDWRQTPLELEEVWFQQKTAAVADIDRQQAALETAAIGADSRVRGWGQLAGRDLDSLASFPVAHPEAGDGPGPEA